MTKKTTTLISNKITDRKKGATLSNNIRRLLNEIDVQKYFNTSTKKQIKNPTNTLFRFHNQILTDWELISVADNTLPITQFNAYKAWNIELGLIPIEYVPFIDVKILWRNQGYNADYVPGYLDQGYYFEVLENEVGDALVNLHAMLYIYEDTIGDNWGGQIQSINYQIEAKLLITFLYPNDLI